MSAETRYWVLRTGSVAAILGSLLAAAGNVIHPVTPRDDPEGVARVIADSGAWTLIHVVIVFGIILMLGGLVGIRHSIEGGKAEALAQVGRVFGHCRSDRRSNHGHPRRCQRRNNWLMAGL